MGTDLFIYIIIITGEAGGQTHLSMIIEVSPSLRNLNSQSSREELQWVSLADCSRLL